jgi:aryl carrier-like protein
VVVFLNGEKTNPISMEQHILASNPGVMGVLVSGAKRVQAWLPVEIAGEVLSPAGRALVMQRIWPSIEEPNSLSPGHARIDKAHILFTTVDKPMLRTSKGTIQRAGTLALYAQELDDLYARLDRVRARNDGLVRPGGGDDVSVVTQYIRNVLISVTVWDEDGVRNDDNLFHLGFDSLHAIAAARQLKYGFDILNITPNMIYQNPSISELTDAVTQFSTIREHKKHPTRNNSKKDPHCYKSSSGISTTIRLPERSLATTLKDIPFSSQALPVPSEQTSSIPCY